MYLNAQKIKWHNFTHEIEYLEQKINQQVYSLFKLTIDEINLLENTLLN